MALYDHYAVATAASSQVLSYDEASILVEVGGFNPTKWFLSRGQTLKVEDEDEPPKKRRKTTTSDGISPIQRDKPEESIPLRRIAIDLHFTETLSTKPPSAKAVEKDVDCEDESSLEVIPSVVDLFDKGTRLKLALPRKKGAVLVVNTDGLDNKTLDVFESTAVLQKNSNAADHPATFSKCTLTRSRGQYTVVRLEVSRYWRSGLSAFPQGVPTGKARIYDDYKMLAELFPDRERRTEESTQPWTPQDFYDSVHVPSRGIATSRDFEGLLDSELYPFQKRAVHWLLQREGVEWHDGQVLAVSTPAKPPVQLFKAETDFEGRTCHVNHLQGIVKKDAPSETSSFSGGLLAEEMGLGKTVELLALLSLHKRSEPLHDTVFDTDFNMHLRPSKATLIITPNTILDQWRSELRKHAPALKVFHYTGISMQNKRSEKKVITELTQNYDVVLATYQTLAKEIHFAEDPPDRAMRHARQYERKRSPLVQIQWWRVCLDEAQMVESGVTAAARVARRLPRIHSWAVSGTPLRKNVQDLHGLLIFLQYKPFCDDPRLWSHLITNHRHLFREIFGHIALRHTKSVIREDLNLPAQKRVVITTPFSAIEQQQYTTLFSQMCEDVGVTNEGAPRHGEWDPDDPDTIEQMRSWLVRLRQTCLHPQVGGKNRKALGRGQGPLRTVAEVLEVMIENNESSLRVEERALLDTQLLIAHVQGNAADDDHRAEKALNIYLAAMETCDNIVKEARQKLAAARQAEFEKGNNTAETDEEDSSTESTPVLGRLRNGLRTAMQLQHESTFFAATAYYNIKANETLTTPDSDRFKELENHEVQLYEQAKTQRREILRDAARKSEALMRRIDQMQRGVAFTKMPKIKDLDSLGGIENQRIIEKSDMIFEVIRAQAKVVAEWRNKIAEYLLKPLVDEDAEGNETTGEEYEDSTKLQDELYPYFDAIKAMHADMNTYITGEAAPLIDHEVKTTVRAAKNFLDPDHPEELKRQVHAPELTLELLGTRNKFMAKKEQMGSVRGLIQEARGLETSLGWGTRQVEGEIVRRHLNALQAVFSSYTKALAGLEKEVDLFRLAQNQRLEFYRQLQELSDAVKPYKDELDPTLDLQALEIATEKEEHQKRNLAQLRTKNRFLVHLREDSNQSEPKICVVCQCPFELGVLTVCGHQYCKDCINHWWGAHRTCPLCKRGLSSADFHNITYRPQQLQAREEVQSGGPSSPTDHSSSPSSRQSSIYSDIDTQLLNEINAIDLPSSYGTKIDTLGRHLHWIREHDPGAKSIVFSQYREFLDVLGAAFADFKIGFKRLGRSANAAERFKQDPSIDCMLLDAKTDSSGLTLVNATHVFICEPLIQTAVELQAIARVHRIGQTRATTVWMYLVNDTVEEAIYEISVARRLAHVQSRQQEQQSKKAQKSRSTTPAPMAPGANAAIDAAETEELQSKPLSGLLVSGKGGGEVVGTGDLWQCLFGKAGKAGQQGAVGEEAEREVGRFLRGEAAEGRREGRASGVGDVVGGSERV